jgi:probable rRNA maturation factor
MEKEINIEAEQFYINFFYDDFELTIIEIEDYKNSLKLMAKGFSIFKDDILGLKTHTLNLNITICDDKKIKDLNQTYRQKDKITDVLSFPLQDNIRNGEYDDFSPELELGDLYICRSVCTEQATEFLLSYQDEFIHLATHGYLHLCGFDHEINLEEEKLMEKLEEDIISSISKIKKGRLSPP